MLRSICHAFFSFKTKIQILFLKHVPSVRNKYLEIFQTKSFMMGCNLKLKYTHFREMSQEHIFHSYLRQSRIQQLHADGHYAPIPVAARSKRCVCGRSPVGL